MSPTDPSPPTEHVVTLEQMRVLVADAISATRSAETLEFFQTKGGEGAFLLPCEYVTTYIGEGNYEYLTDEANLMVMADGYLPGVFWIDPTLVALIATTLATKFDQLPDLMGVESRSWIVVVNRQDGSPTIQIRSEPVLAPDWSQN